MLVFWSKHSSDSPFVKMEVEKGLNRHIQGLTIIPVWLDETPLSVELADYNAIFMKNCSWPEVNKLLDDLKKRPNLTRRASLPFQPNRALKDHSDARAISGLPLFSVPFMTSGHCDAFIVGEEDLSLNHIKAQAEPTMQLLLHFLGGADDTFIQQVYTTFAAMREKDETVSPFFCALHSCKTACREALSR